MESESKLELIITIPNVELYKILNSTSKFQKKGDLLLYRQSKSNITILIISDFQYALADGIPIMVNSESEKRRQYVLPHTECTYGLTFPDDIDNNSIDLFELILQENANLVCQDSETPGELLPQKKSEKIANYISEGGDKVKQGLIKTGAYISKKIIKGGEYLQQKIKKNDKPKEISPDAQFKAKMAKETSNAMLIFTKTQLESLIMVSKTIVGNLADQAGNSESAKKIKNHKNYEDVKNVGIATLHAAAAVYDGLFDALYCMGKGVKDAAGDLVEHKYGKDAGKVAKDGLDVVGNVGYMVRAVKDVSVKEIEKVTDKKKEK